MIANLEKDLRNTMTPVTSLKAQGEEAPIWVPDDDSEKCMRCDAKFTVIHRRVTFFCCLS